MDQAYALAYRALHEEHWWWRARRAFLLDYLRRLAPPGGFGAILDVGCGDGLYFEELSAWGRPEGVEADGSLITGASARFGPIHNVPFDERFAPGKRYGLVLLLDVVEHLEDDRAAMARAADLVEPGGVLIATVPAFQALWTHHDAWNHHHRRYRLEELVALVRGAGLELFESRYFFHWPAPVKLLVRLKEKLVPGKPALPASPPPPVNALLYALSRLEAETIGRLRLPFGSSALAIGRKPAA
jgi:SAM-dependent methyltransferase